MYTVTGDVEWTTKQFSCTLSRTSMSFCN